ncbi:hypothetical protein OAJ95_02825 [Pelagibacteraceae bacterium]|nr:hypothetical protein [Pelagibacteraceae bacterium]
MRFLFFKIIVFFSLVSCSNINFLLDTKENSDFLKNKTLVYVSGWDNPVLKDVLFLKIGEADKKNFLLTAQVNEKQTKRSVSKNQVALKIDYKLTIDYSLNDTTNKCPEIKNRQISKFSFTPKSSGYNFASDVLLSSLYEEAILNNVNNFMSFANNKLKSNNCLDEN